MFYFYSRVFMRLFNYALKFYSSWSNGRSGLCYYRTNSEVIKIKSFRLSWWEFSSDFPMFFLINDLFVEACRKIYNLDLKATRIFLLCVLLGNSEVLDKLKKLKENSEHINTPIWWVLDQDSKVYGVRWSTSHTMGTYYEILWNISSD